MPKFASSNFSKTIENWHVEILRVTTEARSQISQLMSDMGGFLGGLQPVFECWNSTFGDVKPGKKFLEEDQIASISKKLKDNLQDLALILDADVV